MARDMANVLRMHPVRGDGPAIARSVVAARARLRTSMVGSVPPPPKHAVAALLRAPTSRQPQAPARPKPQLIPVPSEPAIDLSAIPLTKKKTD
jgi:hypothetical protein